MEIGIYVLEELNNWPHNKVPQKTVKLQRKTENKISKFPR